MANPYNPGMIPGNPGNGVRDETLGLPVLPTCSLELDVYPVVPTVSGQMVSSLERSIASFFPLAGMRTLIMTYTCQN